MQRPDEQAPVAVSRQGDLAAMLYIVDGVQRLEIWERDADGEWMPRDEIGVGEAPVLGERPSGRTARLTGLVAGVAVEGHALTWATGVAAEEVAEVRVDRDDAAATVPVDEAWGAFLVCSPGASDVVLTPLDARGERLGRPRRYQLA